MNFNFVLAQDEESAENEEEEESMNEDTIEENEISTPQNGTAPAIIDTSFESLADKVSEQTLKAVADMGFTHMTEIQHKSIPYLLDGR